MVIKFANQVFTPDEVISGKIQENTLSAFEFDVVKLVKNWFDDSDYLIVHTSGSTGTPQKIKLSKEFIRYSAETSLEYLDPNRNFENALLCLNPAFIGGIMVVIRALIGDLNLTVISPEADLAETLKENDYDLVSLVPLQVQKLIRTDLNLINQFNCIIIGGAALGQEEISALRKLNTIQCFHSYGMTETASHIALKNLTENRAHFETLGDVEIRTDERSCLTIKGTVTDHKWLTTNDVVEIMQSNRFVWKGRADFVINSGGIKVHPEIVERALSSQIDSPFFIAGLPDNTFGERVVLIIEGISEPSLDYQQIPKYHRPKEILLLPKFDYTESGKINRKATIKKINS